MRRKRNRCVERVPKANTEQFTPPSGGWTEVLARSQAGTNLVCALKNPGGVATMPSLLFGSCVQTSTHVPFRYVMRFSQEGCVSLSPRETV